MTRSGPALKKRDCLLTVHHGPLAWALLLYVDPNPPLHGFSCCMTLMMQNCLRTTLSPSFLFSSMACWLPPSRVLPCSPGWPSEWTFCLSLVRAGLTDVVLLLLLYSILTLIPGFNTHVFHFLHSSSLSSKICTGTLWNTHTHTPYGLSKNFIPTDYGAMSFGRRQLITYVEQSIVCLEHSFLTSWEYVPILFFHANLKMAQYF